MTKLHHALGATDPTGDVSAGRVVLFATFGFFIGAAVWVLWNIRQGNPAPTIATNGTVVHTWDSYSGFFKELVSGLKWFLAPYVAGATRDAITNRPES